MQHVNKPFAFALIAAGLLGTSVHADVLSDPSFDLDPSNGLGGADNAEIGAWYANNVYSAPNNPGSDNASRLWYRAVDMVGPSGSVENVAAYSAAPTSTADTRGLIQVIPGFSGNTGVHSLSFDYLLNDTGADGDLVLRAEVFGINTAAWTGAFDLATPNTDGDVASGDTFDLGQVTQLLNTTAFNITTDGTITGASWQQAAFDVDLGAGFEQLAIRFVASDRGAAGDAIAVDNVNFAAVPEPASLALLGAGMLFVGGRRRR